MESEEKTAIEPVVVLQSTLVDLEETNPDKSLDFVQVPLTKFEFVIVYVALMLAISVFALDKTIVATALPAIAQSFNSLDGVSWVGASFMAASTAFAPVFGSLCDILGRKATFMISMGMFEIGSVICAIAPSLVVLIVGRVVSGIGGGGIMAVILIIISDIVSFRDRGKYQGMLGAFYGLASVFGPLLGGLLSDTVGWRWCFWINPPIGFLAIAAVAYYLKFPNPEGTMASKLHKIDYLGTFLVVAATTLFLIPLQFGGAEWAWSDFKTILCFSLSIVFVILFCLCEVYHARNPIIPPRLFENASITINLIIAFLLGNPLYALEYWIPAYYQIVNGDRAIIAGLRMLPFLVGVIGMIMTTGIYISSTGKYKSLMVYGPIVSIAGEVMLYFMVPSTPKYLQGIDLFVAGAGLGMMVQTRILAIQASACQENLAIATGASNFLDNMGGAVGIAAFGAILSNSLRSTLGNEVASRVTSDPQRILQLDNVDVVLDGVAKAFSHTYYYLIPVTGLLLVGVFMKEYSRPR